MKQAEYENIISCIKYGVPALATDLIKSFNENVQLANERISEIQEENRRKTEEELSRQRKEKEAVEAANSNVTKKK